ncbi:Uncharacterised protein [Streptococcus pneumoniae]|nr:Uncharacterised protein [Streptococcus pneumoniae]
MLYGGIGKKKLEKGGKTFIMDLYLFKPRQRRLGLYMLDFVSLLQPQNSVLSNLKQFEDFVSSIHNLKAVL